MILVPYKGSYILDKLCQVYVGGGGDIAQISLWGGGIYYLHFWIIRHYIADFYVPDKTLIIEVDGRFHNKQKQHDKMGIRTIQEHYFEVEVLRYTWGDVSDLHRLFDLG